MLTTSEVPNPLQAGCPNYSKLLQGRGKETEGETEAREKTNEQEAMNEKQ